MILRSRRRLPMKLRFALLPHLVAFFMLCVPLHAQDWPQFRGPNCSGISTCRNLPTTFSKTDKVLWHAELGDGIGSPVITQGRVFSTAMVNKKTFAVFCHDAATGKQLWSRELVTGPLPRITPPN